MTDSSKGATEGSQHAGTSLKVMLPGYVAVLACSALFGSVFTMLKPPLEKIDPLLLSAIIYVISGLALIPFAKASFRMKVKRDYLYLLIITLFGAVAAPALLFFGLEKTSASDASILTNGEVLFTILISSIFFGERPHGKLGIFAVGLVTVGLFIVTTDLKFSETILEFNEGNLMILGSMFFWAIDNNVSRRFTVSSDASPAKIAMLKSLCGGLILLAISVLFGRSAGLFDIPSDLWPIIVIVAAFGFGGALLLFLQGIKKIGTVRTMSIFSTVPIFGMAIAAAFIGESISATQIFATAIIISGILIISRPHK